jgi:hypothetical protein
VASDRKRKEASNSAEFDCGAGASGGCDIRRCVCVWQQHSLPVVCHFHSSQIYGSATIDDRGKANLLSAAMKLLWVDYEKL